ncbi:barstar family protein [Kitasatospora sp. NPDC091276]|uniref:barstar family protein n=1 Tax=Kitasatospora sp. NPDC091276 TaxID=3155300 RepID=UPI00341E7620
MVTSATSFTFSFHVDDDEETYLGNFSNLDNFFTGSSSALSEFDDEAAGELHGSGAWLQPRISGLLPSEALKGFWNAASVGERSLGNVRINIHDVHGQIIGSYFLGSVTLEDWIESPDLTVTATLSCWVGILPERSASTLWKTWSHHAPSMNDWVNLPLGEREGWIEVARMYGKTSHRANGADCEYVLIGTNIHDLASFYCAIGEAMNGPGGYYGSNLAALDDCLFGGCGPAAPFKLVWQDSSIAANTLDALPTYSKNKTVMSLILECFKRRGVAVELA